MDAAQTYDSEVDNDLAELKAARARLRAFAGLVAEAVESIDMPESFLEGERAARAVIAADRMVTSLPVAEILEAEATPIIAPARKRLRVYAHRLLDAIEKLPLPKTFLEGERAGRCVLATDRMLSQLYEAPRPEASRVPLPGIAGLKAAKPAAKSVAGHFDDNEDDEDREPTGDDYKAVLAFRIDHLVRSRAKQSGFWNDGHPYDPADPDYGCIYQNFAIPGFDPLDALVPADRFALAHARKAGDPIAPP
ncbi:MAG: hypothetical protein QM647_02415 [Asticcacaulis sp.]|uniref:hypothetical protein n=1 Tax=Asticcacaulis sp. TaxID=1872648 RepID=UPI0039E5F7FA